MSTASEASALDATIRSIVRDVVREEIRAAFDERARLTTRNANASAGEGGYLSITRAAALADVAAGTLRRWIKEGRIPVRRAGRVYRIARTDLDSFLRGGQSTAVVDKARSILGARA